VDARVQALNVRPVGAAERGRGGRQVAVAAGERAAGQRPCAALDAVVQRREVTPAGVVREARRGDGNSGAEHDGGGQYAPRSLRQEKSTSPMRRNCAAAIQYCFAHFALPLLEELCAAGPDSAGRNQLARIPPLLEPCRSPPRSSCRQIATMSCDSVDDAVAGGG